MEALNKQQQNNSREHKADGNPENFTKPNKSDWKALAKYKLPHKYLIKAPSNLHKDNWVKNYTSSLA